MIRCVRGSRSGPKRGRQQGAIAIMTGLAIVMLMGFLAIAIDVGRLFVLRSEVQTAMDACALAAATQLRPGLADANALDRAMAYGRGPGNRVNFQGSVVDPQSIRFAFSVALNGPYAGYSGGGAPSGLANSARYVRCSYPIQDVPMYFARILSPANATVDVTASAVATLMPSQTSCGFPVALCRASSASAASAPAWGLSPGAWVGGLGGTGGAGGANGCSAGTGSGNFCWIDFSPPTGGAAELAGLMRGPGQCTLTINNPIGQTGVAASLTDAWNSRFGIYKSHEVALGAGGPLSTAPPDFTGYSYTASNWPAQSNAYPDYLARRDGREPFNADSGVSLTGNATAISAAQHATYGRDRRLVLAPIVDCALFASSQSVPMDAWGCVLLLAPISTPGAGSFSARLEYRGLASEPGSPCASSGLAGGTAGPAVPVLAQ